MNTHQASNKGRVLMAGILVLFTVGIMVLFYREDDAESLMGENGMVEESIFGAERGQNVSLRELTNDPNAFRGRLVSVRGLVKENIGTRGLTIESSDINTDELLVISKDTLVDVGGGPGIPEHTTNDGVRVSGEIRIFNLGELEEELGTDLNDDTYRQYEGKPVIIADTIDPMQEL